jgi:hypothetical protein
MIHIRPLAGAVLMTLLLTPVALADRVDVITPGGNASLLPPSTDTEPRDATVETLPVDMGTGGSKSTDYSPAEVDTRPGLQTMHFGGATLACKVGSGARDLVVVNQSLEPLPSGTRIKWQLKKEGTRGFFAIIGDLGGGESLVADDVLDGKANTDDICIARVI